MKSKQKPHTLKHRLLSYLPLLIALGIVGCHRHDVSQSFST